MSSITQALNNTFRAAVEQAAYEVIKEPSDWKRLQETQQAYDRQVDECRQRFDEQFDDLVSLEAIRLAQKGPSQDINGPDGAPAGETLEQRAQRNVVNAHQRELDQIQEARTNALATVLETARSQQDASLETSQGRARDAFDQVNDRRKTPDRRAPARQR